jgi:hypothetical protein
VEERLVLNDWNLKCGLPGKVGGEGERPGAGERIVATRTALLGWFHDYTPFFKLCLSRYWTKRKLKQSVRKRRTL